MADSPKIPSSPLPSDPTTQPTSLSSVASRPRTRVVSFEGSLGGLPQGIHNVLEGSGNTSSSIDNIRSRKISSSSSYSFGSSLSSAPSSSDSDEENHADMEDFDGPLSPAPTLLSDDEVVIEATTLEDISSTKSRKRLISTTSNASQHSNQLEESEEALKDLSRAMADTNLQDFDEDSNVGSTSASAATSTTQTGTRKNEIETPINASPMRALREVYRSTSKDDTDTGIKISTSTRTVGAWKYKHKTENKILKVVARSGGYATRIGETGKKDAQGNSIGNNGHAEIALGFVHKIGKIRLEGADELIDLSDYDLVWMASTNQPCDKKFNNCTAYTAEFGVKIYFNNRYNGKNTNTGFQDNLRGHEYKKLTETDYASDSESDKGDDVKIEYIFVNSRQLVGKKIEYFKEGEGKEIIAIPLKDFYKEYDEPPKTDKKKQKLEGVQENLN